MAIQTNNAMATVVQMMRAVASALRITPAMASAFWTRSVRAFYLPDTECQGKCPTDYARCGICLPCDAHHSICLPDEESQGIPLQDPACLLQMQSVKANVVRTTQATASASLTRSVMAFHFGTQCVSYRCRVSRQMLSGRHVPQHLPSGRGVSGHDSFRTQSVKVNVLRTTCIMASALQMTCATASAFRMRSVRALFLPDTECQG